MLPNREKFGASLRRWSSLLHQSHPGLVLALGVALVALVATGEEFSSPHVPLGLFYSLPIALVTWYVGGGWGLGFGCFAGLAAAFFALGYMPDRAGVWMIAWSFTARVSSFAVTAALIWSLRNALENQRALANTDPITGIGNARAFRVTAIRELARCSRQHVPLTAVYLDCDNFKAVNDRYGHAGGDRLLQTVARVFTSHLRFTDHVARVGGDEFALILPGVSASDAGPVISKMHELLLDEMRRHNWPVTFSVGVATFNSSPRSVDDLLAKIDALQYRAKTTGKNKVIYDVVEALPALVPAPAAA
ncbi:MAG: GGDEF domain-containing protein [Phycisphaerales bacterium]